MDCFKTFTPAEKETAIATIGVKISELEANDFKTKMINLIGQTYLNCGFKLDENQVTLTINELCEDLKKYNITLTFEEIQLAFKNGYKKQYGDFFGLSNATYFGWVNAYTCGESRLKVKKTLLSAKENANKQPEIKSPAEINKIMKDSCLKSFEDFKIGVVVLDAGNVKYNYLVKKEVLNISKEKKAEFMILAEKNLKSLAIETKGKTETIEKCFGKIVQTSIVSEAKKLALIDFYKNLASNDFDLNDLIID